MLSFLQLLLVIGANRSWESIILKSASAIFHGGVMQCIFCKSKFLHHKSEYFVGYPTMCDPLIGDIMQ